MSTTRFLPIVFCMAAVLVAAVLVDGEPDARAGAGTIARLARGRLAAGRAVPAALAAPLYVRDRVALTIDERRAAAERA